MITPFGKLLRIFRVKNDLTMRSLALKLGVTSAYISGIENGKFQISESFLTKLFNTFSIDSKEQQKFREASVGNVCITNSSIELINALSRKELSKEELAELELLIKKKKESLWKKD